MRVTSALWVSAFLRRCMANGLVAVVERKGNVEAGAIFVVVDRLNGTVDLYGPAPQTAFEDDQPTDRLFQRVLALRPHAELTSKLTRETQFDPDLWVVTVEERNGNVPLDVI